MLYRRGSKWWVRFTARGREIRVTSGTDRRELAEEFEQRLREAIWREKALGQETHTWEEACARWLKEKSAKRSLLRDEQSFALVRTYLAGKSLAEIDGRTIADIRSGISVGRSVGTVNRTMAVVRSTLNAAIRWGWIERAPNVTTHAEPRREPRWITHEQFNALCAELVPHAKALAQFAAYTGARSANIFALKWENVDLRSKVFWVAARNAKGGRALGIPLSKEALGVLDRARGRHPIYVFTDHKGRAPLKSLKTCWTKAIKRAGLQGFRFHDLRHTWAAWHTLSGTPPIVLKELGGWSSLSMVERYAHLNPGHLAGWANNAVPYKSRHSGPKKKRKAYKTRVPRGT